MGFVLSGTLSTMWFPPVGARSQLQRAQGHHRGANLTVRLTLGMKLPTEGREREVNKLKSPINIPRAREAQNTSEQAEN